MGQINVNPGPSGDGEAAAVGMSVGLMLVLAIAVIVLLVLAFFWVRPLVFGGPTDINVTIRSSDLIDMISAYI